MNGSFPPGWRTPRAATRPDPLTAPRENSRDPEVGAPLRTGADPRAQHGGSAMITAPSSLAGVPTRAYRARVNAARALGYGFLLLGWRLIGPFVHVVTWLRRPHDSADPGSHGLAVAPSWLPATPIQPSQTIPAHPADRFADRLGLAEVECVEVEPAFNERLYATVFALVQLGPRSKLLDLRPATTIKLNLFEGLAAAWKAPPGTVPRLGILLDYEAWAVLRHAAARSLKPIIDRGVEVELFYAQQIDSVPLWFAQGHAYYEQIPAVLEWLRTQWRATAVWPAVLSTTSMLVHACAPTEDVPDLLIELAAIALSLGSMEAAEHAVGHARAALSWIGDKPCAARCRALRSLATATLAKGETEAGLALLESAITTAALIRDPIEEASALQQIGCHAVSGQHFARAEDRFRQAMDVLSNAGSPHLRATLHHDLAAVLHAQGKNDEEAEDHAIAALDLQGDRDSPVAQADRALLSRIHARRLSRRG